VLLFHQSEAPLPLGAPAQAPKKTPLEPAAPGGGAQYLINAD